MRQTAVRLVMVPILVLTMLLAGLLVGHATSSSRGTSGVGTSVTEEVGEPQAIWFTGCCRLFGPWKSYFVGVRA